MDTNIKKAEPYRPEEMMFDGPLDKARLLATLEQKYRSEKQTKSRGKKQ